jgi:hypothetical protein
MSSLPLSFLKVFRFHPLPYPPSPFPLPLKLPVDKAFVFALKGNLTKSSKSAQKTDPSTPIARRFLCGIQHSALQIEKSTEAVVERSVPWAFCQMTIVDRQSLTKSYGF